MTNVVFLITLIFGSALCPIISFVHLRSRTQHSVCGSVSVLHSEGWVLDHIEWQFSFALLGTSDKCCVLDDSDFRDFIVSHCILRFSWDYIQSSTSRCRKCYCDALRRMGSFQMCSSSRHRDDSFSLCEATKPVLCSCGFWELCPIVNLMINAAVL